MFHLLVVVALVATEAYGQGMMSNAQSNPGKEWTRGVCLDAWMSPNSSLSIIGVPYKLPGCFNSISFPESARKAFHDCGYIQESAKMMANKAQSMSAMLDQVNKLEECGLRSMNLIKGNSIDIDAMDQMMDSFTGDAARLEDLRKIYQVCKDNFQASGNAVQDGYYFKECSTRGIYDFCSAISGDVGMMGSALAMMTLDQEPKCRQVDVKVKLMPIVSCMAKAWLARMRNNPAMRGKFSMSSFDPKKMMSPRKMAEMTATILRALGLFDETTNEFMPEVMIALINDLNDWSGLELERNAIINAVNVCAAANSRDLSANEIARRFPWIPRMHPVMYRLHLFNQCFVPKVADQCGVRNQLGIVLNPLLARFLPSSEMNEIMGGDMDQMLDEFIKQTFSDSSMADMDENSQCM